MNMYESISKVLKETEVTMLPPTGKVWYCTLPAERELEYKKALRILQGVGIDFTNIEFMCGGGKNGPTLDLNGYFVSLYVKNDLAPENFLNIYYGDQEELSSVSSEWDPIIEKVKNVAGGEYLDNVLEIPISKIDIIREAVNLVKGV